MVRVVVVVQAKVSNVFTAQFMRALVIDHTNPCVEFWDTDERRSELTVTDVCTLSKLRGRSLGQQDRLTRQHGAHGEPSRLVGEGSRAT